MKLRVSVTADEFFDAHKGPGIIGPSEDDDSTAWVVYLPDEVPCICESFKDAAEMMSEWCEDNP